VFIHTSPFRKDPQYSRSMTVPLVRPTADTAFIVAAVVSGLKAIYRPGFKYAKAGVMLMELQSDSVLQTELDLGDSDCRDRGKLMSTLDGLNQRYGKGSVLMASAGLKGNNRVWSMKQERRTPGYTTRFEDIPVARA
jgi:DNA polymerase V